MAKKRSLREYVYHLIDNDEEQTFGSQSFEIFITILILLSIVAIILESFENLRGDYAPYFTFFENITLVIFTIEYLLRLATADIKYKDSKSWSSAAVRLATSGSGIIDLMAIAPMILHLASIFGIGRYDFRFIRILKITRLLRIFKMTTFTNSIKVVADVFREKKDDLGITVLVAFILLLVSSTIMWYVEGPEQPEQFPNILASFWWAVATLTTVGYGDVFPITPLGKFLSGIIALLGIGLVALPAGILSSAFVEKLEKRISPKEEDNHVSKIVLPQAQFQKVASKKEEELIEKIIIDNPIAAKNHQDCKASFGQAFIYCPYCGEKLDETAS